LSGSTLLKVEEEIRRRIAEKGCITFAEFMEVALFWPRGGYYSSWEGIGPEGDYYTAPAAHPAFGALLAIQLLQMWEILGQPTPFHVVELGAGRGILARDVLEYSASLPDGFLNAIRYVCVDRWLRWGCEKAGPGERTFDAERLAAVNVSLHQVVGCFLSNELVDSFPVHRVAVEDGALREVYVTVGDDGLQEVLREPSTPRLQKRFQELGLSLPEGYRTEVNLAIETWVQEVAAALERGFVLTVDYGYTAEDYYSPRRDRGTLACFYKHVQTDDPYRRLGRQDITSHVEFTSLMRAGEKANLATQAFITQGLFLRNLGLERFLTGLGRRSLSTRDMTANRLGMLELVRPEGMGRFKVLIQGKKVPRCDLWGVTGAPSLPLQSTPVPLLAPRHMPLFEGRYPGEAFAWEHLWPG